MRIKKARRQEGKKARRQEGKKARRQEGKNLKRRVETSGNKMSEPLLYPLLLVGPANSGKTKIARKNFGASDDAVARLRTLEIDDYSARFIEFTTHLEIDVTDLSMTDKKSLPELLNHLISTRDVLAVDGKKKMIIRRIHNLSPPAAIQLRVCLEQFVFNGLFANALVQCTARTVNSSVITIMDGFVFQRIPLRVQKEEEKEEKEKEKTPLQGFIFKIICSMMNSSEKTSIDAALWIRARVYDIMGLMISGGDLIAWCSLAIVRLAMEEKISSATAKRTITKLADIRWIPSYRIPLMMEFILVTVYDSLKA